jgi:MinD superfamily P-loop ATPase
MMVAVASGKGGTGKTLVSSALALSLETCTYVDLDVEEPNSAILVKPEIEEEISFGLPVPEFDNSVCSYCGECARVCSYNALAVIPTIKKVMFFPDLCHFCGACSYVCPKEGAIKEKQKEIGTIRIGRFKGLRFMEGRLNIGQPSAVPLIRAVLNKVADSPLVIADCPPGTSCPVVESLRQADYVILVTEPTPFGLNDLELTIELVNDLGKPMGIVINKSGNGFKLDTDFLACIKDIPILMRIPYSLDIQKGYSEGRPLGQISPHLNQHLRDIVQNILLSTKRNNNE